jgi:phosphotransferase system  glucose/maltose/N-acetylglucosamine-specific IIC component
MLNVKALLELIIGMIFIIGGFLSFVLTVITAKLWGVDLGRHNLLVALGCLLIIIGSIILYFFTKIEPKKKKGTQKKKTSDDTSSVEVT